LNVAWSTCVQPERLLGKAEQFQKSEVALTGSQSVVCVPPVHWASMQLAPLQLAGALQPRFVLQVPLQPSGPPHVAVAQLGAHPSVTSDVAIESRASLAATTSNDSLSAVTSSASPTGVASISMESLVATPS
jgi:hypothetical protein